MAAKKEQGRGASGQGFGLWALAGWLVGPGRVWIVLILGLGALGGGWYGVWYGLGVGRRVLSGRDYLLMPDDLEMTPLPPWIHTDIRAELYRDASLEGPLSIHDDRLLRRLRDVLVVHPWIAKVQQIVKRYPAHVRIDVEYRQPVCMVEVTGGLYPVDAEGAWLPVADFSPVEASQYPRLAGVRSSPIGPVGTRWGDPGVSGGAEIAAALREHWTRLGLDHILPAAGEGRLRDTPWFELFTPSGRTRILWGPAPSGAPPGEVSAAEKVRRLVNYAEQHGRLDDRTGRQEIDLRSPQGIQVRPRG